MMKYHEKGDMVEIMIDGGVTKDEFDDIAARLERAIGEHGKVRILEEVRSLGGIEPAVFWPDLKFGLRHLNHFSRCAVVTDKTWIEWFAKAVDPLIPCEVRHFPPERIENARDWLREDTSQKGESQARATT
jgi:hypothetical protein